MGVRGCIPCIPNFYCYLYGYIKLLNYLTIAHAYVRTYTQRSSNPRQTPFLIWAQKKQSETLLVEL
jgi:hypothetical protein